MKSLFVTMSVVCVWGIPVACSSSFDIVDPHWYNPKLFPCVFEPITEKTEPSIGYPVRGKH